MGKVAIQKSTLRCFIFYELQPHHVINVMFLFFLLISCNCLSQTIFFYLPYLFFIHEKAKCIAIIWTRHPYLYESCYFRGVWATCFPHKDGDISLGALPKITTSKLAGLFSTISNKCRAPSREAVNTIF